jgi:hypothetical protein
MKYRYGKLLVMAIGSERRQKARIRSCFEGYGLCSLEMATLEPSTPFGSDSSSSDESLLADIRPLSEKWSSRRVVFIYLLVVIVHRP